MYVCLKQYVGQTVEGIYVQMEPITRTVVVNIKIMAHVCTNTFLSIFLRRGHHSFLEDVTITLVDKTDPSIPLQREIYWRSILKTMATWGLNVEDCV